MPEFRYRIRPGHKHYSGGKCYRGGDEIVFPRSMRKSDIAAKLEPIDDDSERAAAPRPEVNTLQMVRRADGAGYDLCGDDGRRINRMPMSKDDAELALAATTAPADEDGDGEPGADPKRPFSMEQPGGVGGWVVRDADGFCVHPKQSRISKAQADKLIAENGTEPAPAAA